ncbi:hypothetical protein [uncultured Mailhella sp.]|uniref:hypothetical protein n=1 Tax=uncultured Mailhella sp. TaxID=1981031 RepID=UPI00320ADA73
MIVIPLKKKWLTQVWKIPLFPWNDPATGDDKNLLINHEQFRNKSRQLLAFIEIKKFLQHNFHDCGQSLLRRLFVSPPSRRRPEAAFRHRDACKRLSGSSDAFREAAAAHARTLFRAATPTKKAAPEGAAPKHRKSLR